MNTISINLWSHLNLYITIVLNNKYYPFSWFMVTVVILVSPIVILNSIDYLSIMDSYPFLFYIILFQFSMINFVLMHDIIIASFYWDLLGLISYLLINYWTSKVNCGIKAVIYNKIGDNFSLFILVLFYLFLSFISYYPELPYSIFLFYSEYFFTSFNSFSTFFYLIILHLFPLSLFSILYSKSAQLPFSTWLLNAMSAPTPISALLHSSTMVIAGVFRYYYSWHDYYNTALFFLNWFIFLCNTIEYFIMIFIEGYIIKWYKIHNCFIYD
jgi:NADH:ubiquinone oxidoreductase subunit 5 (subunit L)/multisubunit Na+/H+ antiporter MnhA subunit